MLKDWDFTGPPYFLQETYNSPQNYLRARPQENSSINP